MAKVTRTTKTVEKVVTEEVPVFTLDLTEDQLIGLGVLSFRHELFGLAGGKSTFFSSLPVDVRRSVQARAERVRRNTTGLATTAIGVDWSISA